SIKIDRSLTQRLGTRKMDKVLSAMASMAKGIGATLLAEGIETQAQADAMTELGVDVGQGYLWAKPLAKGDLGDWLKAYNHRQSLKRPEASSGRTQPRLS
ncbi:MAG: EAL domain-containing protein, partial [Pseudomonadota bacterium]